MPVFRRAMGAVSRRTGRPELLAAIYSGARQELYEQLAIKAILAAALAADASYVDVGANRGQVLAEALRVAPRGRHVAFEPIPELAAELARRFAGVECRQLAIGAAPGQAKFCHFRNLDGWSGLRRSPEVSDEQGDPEYIEVNVSTLDRELADEAPRVVKIDVEGAELEVIDGAQALLTTVRPIVIFEHVAAAASLYGASSERLWSRLDALGYEVFAVTGDGPYARGSFVANVNVVNWLARPTETVSHR
jgi:FkbM family methyltransferase